MILGLLKKTIRLYQKSISPDHGIFRLAFPSGVCRFHPTCSEYMLTAINEQGWAGVVSGLKRLARCHPYSSL